MSSNSPGGQVSSPWIVSFDGQIKRGKHVLLHGNIYDKCLFDGEYYNVRDLVGKRLLQLGYEVIVEFDPIDELRFNSDQARDTFSELAEADRTGPPSQGTEPLKSGSMVPPVRVSGEPARPTNPVEIIGRVRRALAQPDIGVACILDLFDMLTGDSQHFAPDERMLLMSVRKCMTDSMLVEKGSALGLRNAAVILASDLRRVPAWLYAENPLIAVLEVPRPSKEERKAFFERYGTEFAEGRILQAIEIEMRSTEFADLTDGMATWDMEAIRRTSVSESITVRESQSLKRLVDLYKFGKHEDPWVNVDDAKIKNAQPVLTKRVIGQERAVSAVVDMLVSARVGVTSSPPGPKGGRPRGVFFFVGPTGVGKTELAKAMTELVFGDESAFARFDMSEYKEEHSAERLAGSPPGYVGYEAGGQLTRLVMEKPFSVILFDEIEKAHPKVMDKFLQILEDGRLTDGRGQTAYFHETAIVFTSNIGSSDIPAEAGSPARKGVMSKFLAGASNEVTYDAISEHFKREVQWYFTQRIGRAEIYNRLGDNIVVFDVLRPQHISAIGDKFMAALAASATDKMGVTMHFAPNVKDWLQHAMLQGDNLLFGGRRIKTILESRLERPLNRWIFENDPPKHSSITVSISDEGAFVFGLDG